MDLLPAPGVRLNPTATTGDGTFATQQDAMPKIITSNSDGALVTSAKAFNYWFTGIEFALAPNVTLNYGLVRLGDPEIAQNTLTVVPHHLGIDRCYIHGSTTADLSRGVALNSAASVIVNSYISECHGVGFDTQAIGGWNGPGPYRINNNYLEAAGENILFGGSDPYIPNLVHSDIEIRNNLFSKQLSWWTSHPSYAGKHWSVKNIFELKNARRVLVEGNIFENCWSDAQAGVPILFTVRNQYGTAPWSVVEDVTFINNIIRHVPSVFNILGKDNNQTSEQTKRIKIANNICYDVDRTYYQGNGTFLQITEAKDITVDHNTVIHTGNTVSAYGVACENTVFTNNLFASDSYGINGDNMGYGNAAMANYFPDMTDANQHFHKNVIMGAYKSAYSNYTTISDNEFPTTLPDINFVDFANGASDYHNYMLAANSQFKNDASNGKDIGVDLALLDSALNTLPSDELILTSPANNATGINTSPTLTWNSMPCSPNYRYEVDTTLLFNSGLLQTGTTTAQNLTQLSGLMNNTSYYWRVKVFNSTDSSLWSKTWKFTTDNLTAIAPAIKNSGVNVFPNPATTVLHVLLDQATTSFKIIDVLGKKVDVAAEMITNKNYNVNIETLAPGVYFMVLQNGGATTYQKFIKK